MECFQESGIEKVQIPGTVKTIEACAFLRCANLRAIDLPDSLETIKKGAFAQCGLKSVEIPHNVTDIGVRAFEGCSALAEVKFAGGSSLSRIGENAFAGIACANVWLPACVEEFYTDTNE